MPDRRAPTLWHSFRARLPIMAAEAVSVVFAVLVALAVDEWWEDRENAELGRRGMAAVAAELQGNLDELRGGAAGDTILAGLDDALVKLAADEDPDSLGLSVTYPVALLSDAAWQTAQVTRAVHYVPLETVVRTARVYDLQDFFLENQGRLTEQIAVMGTIDEAGLERGLRELRARYRAVSGFREALMNSYSCSIAELNGRTPESSLDCRATTGGAPQ